MYYCEDSSKAQTCSADAKISPELYSKYSTAY